MKNFLSYLSIYILFSTSVYSQSDIVTPKEIIPFEIVSNWPIVKVFVNGKGPFNFMLDTGATSLGRIDRSLYEELSLEESGSTNNFDGINTASAKLVLIDKIRFGSLQFNKRNIMMRDYPDEVGSGILGRSFFSEKILTIDYPNKKIILSDQILDKRMDNVAPYSTPFHIMGKVNGVDMKFSIDTGSTLAFHFPKSFLIDNNIPFENTGKVSTGYRANTVIELIEAKLLGTIQLSGIEVSDQLIYYSDMQKGRINVGSDILKKYELTIDQRNNLILISE